MADCLTHDKYRARGRYISTTIHLSHGHNRRYWSYALVRRRTVLQVVAQTRIPSCRAGSRSRRPSAAAIASVHFTDLMRATSTFDAVCLDLDAALAKIHKKFRNESRRLQAERFAARQIQVIPPPSDVIAP